MRKGSRRKVLAALAAAALLGGLGAFAACGETGAASSGGSDGTSAPGSQSAGEYAVEFVARGLIVATERCASDLSGAGFCDVGAAAEVSCSVFAGYDFLGWYEGETLVSGERTFSYTMPDREVTLEARTRVSEEMRNFRFTSSAAGCTISGVVDATAKEISVPAYASVKDGAFAGCDSLESLTLPSMEAEDFLGRYFGAENYVLNEEDIPQSLKSVEITGGEEVAEYAFYVCLSLERIAVAESVKKISEAAFYGCAALKSIAIPESVEKIGQYAFWGTALESAAIRGEGSWQYFDSDGGTPEVSGDIPAEELSDPAAAAKALSQTYAGFYLLRKTASPDV